MPPRPLVAALVLAGAGTAVAGGDKMPNPQFLALVEVELRSARLLDDVDVTTLTLSQAAAIHHLLTQGSSEHDYLTLYQRVLAIARRD